MSGVCETEDCKFDLENLNVEEFVNMLITTYTGRVVSVTMSFLPFDEPCLCVLGCFLDYTNNKVKEGFPSYYDFIKYSPVYITENQYRCVTRENDYGRIDKAFNIFANVLHKCKTDVANNRKTLLDCRNTIKLSERESSHEQERDDF